MAKVNPRFIHGLDMKSLILQRGHVLSGNAGSMGTKYDANTIPGLLHVTKGFRIQDVEKHFYGWFSVKANRDDARGKILRNQNEEIVVDASSGLVLRAGEVTLNQFTKTFEWYTSEILVRELGFLNAGFSIHIDGAPHGGDYDVLGFTPKEMIYIECKTGRPTHLGVQDFTNFIDRAKFLSATLAILYVDFVNVGNNQFPFRNFADAIDPNHGDDIFRIRDVRGGPGTFRPLFSPYYVVDCSRTQETAVHNIRFALRSHYAIEELLGRTSGISPMALDAAHYAVTQEHARRP